MRFALMTTCVLMTSPFLVPFLFGFSYTLLVYPVLANSTTLKEEWLHLRHYAWLDHAAQTDEVNARALWTLGKLGYNLGAWFACVFAFLCFALFLGEKMYTGCLKQHCCRAPPDDSVALVTTPEQRPVAQHWYEMETVYL